MSYALRLQVFRDDDDDDKCRFLEKIVDTADTPQVICTYQQLINCMKSPVKKERKELTVSDSSQCIRIITLRFLTHFLIIDLNIHDDIELTIEY